jgi:hypothetical protein
MDAARFLLSVSTSALAWIPLTLSAAPPPLSCEIEALLNGTTAMHRDAGASRIANALNKNPDGELTNREIKEILDRVYIHQKNRTPDQIKDAVYGNCKKRR